MVTDDIYTLSRTDETVRTFETRVLFIKEIFSARYSQQDIIKKSIEHKLNRSYEAYMAELQTKLDLLVKKIEQNPIKVLKNTEKRLQNDTTSGD